MGGCPLTQLTQLPPYLMEPEKDVRTYGVLKYDRKGHCWIIEAEPSVAAMAKRLFPGSRGRGNGAAKFPANKRSTGDLNWLMLRFPLTIQDAEEWERARQDAVDYVLKRREMAERPQQVAPPATFVGQLQKFQQEGLAFLLHNERTLLADEMGLGKTPTALAWLASVEAWPALIVVMPHLARQWVREITKFLALNPPGQGRFFPETAKAVHVIKGLTPYRLPPASIYVMHYLLLRGWKQYLPRHGFQAVVFDEIQELRHRGTEKYSSASALASKCPRVIGLSGTPIYNKGGEIWNVLNIIEHHCLGDWDSFTREWCDGYGNEVVKKPDLLGSYLRREGLLLRRTKEQVLDQLPPKRRFVQAIDADGGIYDSLIGPAIAAAQKVSTAATPFDRGRFTREAISETRRVTGIAKAKHVCAFVRGLLEAGETVLLFAYHHDVWDKYTEMLGDFKPVRITGKETPAQKEEAQSAFMAGKTNLCEVSLRAAAGLNLQRANVVVFGELDWSPAIHSQAEDRAHRMGQRDSVLCYYLVCDEGTDQDMVEALGLKVGQFIGIMGDRAETEQDRMLAQTAVEAHMKRLVERLQERGKASERPQRVKTAAGGVDACATS